MYPSRIAKEVLSDDKWRNALTLGKKKDNGKSKNMGKNYRLNRLSFYARSFKIIVDGWNKNYTGNQKKKFIKILKLSVHWKTLSTECKGNA